MAPHSTDVTIKWMWGDAGLGYQIEKLNPFRWSSSKGVKETVAELEACSDSDKGRPVAVRIWNRCFKEELFSNVKRAVEGISKVVVFTDREGDCNTIMQRVSDVGLCWSLPGLGKRDIVRLSITMHPGSCFGISGPFGLSRIADPAPGAAQKELIRRLLEVAVLNSIPVDGEGLKEFSEVIVTNKAGKSVTVPITDGVLTPYDIDELQTVTFKGQADVESRISICDAQLIWTYDRDTKPVEVLRVELFHPDRHESVTSEGQFELHGPFGKIVIDQPPGPKQKPLIAKLLTLADKCGVHLIVGSGAAAAVGRPVVDMEDTSAVAGLMRSELEFGLISLKPGVIDALRSTDHPAKSWIDKAEKAQTEKKYRESVDCMHRAQLEVYDDVQKIKSAFQYFDRDGDGSVSLAELHPAVEYLGLPAEDADVKKLFEEVDGDHDGKVNYNELELWIIKQGGIKNLLKRHRKDLESNPDVNPDEAQRLALMEAGITPETLSFWGPTLPVSERVAIVELKAEQRHAVAHTRTVSKYYHKQAWAKLIARVTKIGFSEKDVFSCLDYIREQAPLIIHLQLDKKIGDEHLIDKLAKDTHYRNQFETGVSGGYLGTDVRKSWEHDLFGDAYDKAEGADRPKYGVLNITNDPRGCASCRQYGDSYLLLKSARLRTTFSAQDSANLKAEKIACCDYYAHVLNEYTDAELGRTLMVGSGVVDSVKSEVIRNYKEAQFHGMVLLSQHVVKLVAHERLKKDESMKAKVEAACKKHNFELLWMDDQDDELKRKRNKKAHVLAVGDKVIAKYPAYREKKDSPWFAGTVTAIDIGKMRCSIEYEDGDRSADVQENEVVFAPARKPNWGKGGMRISDWIPRQASPVVFKAHVISVGDLVVAKFPPFRKRSDNAWYAGSVTSIDVDKMQCSIKFCKEPEEKDPESGICQDEVLYAPSREAEWGKDKLRGNDLVPEGSLPVTFQESKDESTGSEAPKASKTPIIEETGGGKCDSGLHDMVLSEKVVNLPYNSYICNGCRKLLSGNRWFCAECKCDYCFECRPIKRVPKDESKASEAAGDVAMEQTSTPSSLPGHSVTGLLQNFAGKRPAGSESLPPEKHPKTG